MRNSYLKLRENLLMNNFNESQANEIMNQVKVRELNMKQEDNIMLGNTVKGLETFLVMTDKISNLIKRV